jgi:hypothetical protein
MGFTPDLGNMMWFGYSVVNKSEEYAQLIWSFLRAIIIFRKYTRKHSRLGATVTVMALHRLPYRRYYGRRHCTIRVLSKFGPYPATAQLTPYPTISVKFALLTLFTLLLLQALKP